MQIVLLKFFVEKGLFKNIYSQWMSKEGIVYTFVMHKWKSCWYYWEYIDHDNETNLDKNEWMFSVNEKQKVFIIRPCICNKGSQAMFEALSSYM